MIDLKVVREDPEAVRRSQQRRGEDPALVDVLLAATCVVFGASLAVALGVAAVAVAAAVTVVGVVCRFGVFTGLAATVVGVGDS